MKRSLVSTLFKTRFYQHREDFKKTFSFPYCPGRNQSPKDSLIESQANNNLKKKKKTIPLTWSAGQPESCRVLKTQTSNTKVSKIPAIQKIYCPKSTV